eukprot:CAMPEP_0179895230 /NCGR_PEP_ID=MMETSP0982-20121206/35711_1 /TAXON_ID=483367 /ORGANISM="non described non described, Strain CCMP 2436" /LENGTH=187 /DNA_ID=CAMNT_0021791879 /DNA_START=61 /DNA_END=621 /DNA_ORIENTATION=+
MDDVVRALAAVHAPLTSPAERLAATRLLEVFKLGAAEQLGAVLALAGPERPAHERHFALHALVALVRARWPALDAARREEVKSLALQLVAAVGERAEASFVVGAAVTFVCELAKREWPQRWPPLADELLALGRRSPRHAALALECLASLSDEARVFALDELPESRRTELRKGLEAICQDVAAFAHGA